MASPVCCAALSSAHLALPLVMGTDRKTFNIKTLEGWLSWSKAPVLKTGEGQPSVGSNPTPSAILDTCLLRRC